MNNIPYPLLTRKQVEDYLIYHCPLLRSTPADTLYVLSYSQLEWNPFMVKFQTDVTVFTVIHENPWRAYQDLSWDIHQDRSARSYITNLYYNS